VYIKVDGKAEAKPDLMLIKAVQLDHLGSTVLHVDFNRVDITKKVRVPLHLELRGKPAGAEEGGVLNQVLQQIEVECLPLDIPREALKISVVDLKVGDILHVKELKLPATIHAVTGGDTVVATVKVPLAKAEGAAAEGEAEPEVLKKGKGEEEGAAAGAAPAAPAAKAEKK
jgi:large subunit ribosomal protein L25